MSPGNPLFRLGALIGPGPASELASLAASLLDGPASEEGSQAGEGSREAWDNGEEEEEEEEEEVGSQAEAGLMTHQAWLHSLATLLEAGSCASKLALARKEHAVLTATM